MKKHKPFYIFSIVISIFLLQQPLLKAQFPSIISPKNNYVTTKDSVCFSWNSVNESSSYELNIAEDPGFTLNNTIYTIYNSVTDTTLKNLSNCKTYYWRVRALLPSPTNYSNVLSFSLFTPKCIPGLELWLDPESGIVMNASNQISGWMDRSGNGKNASQTTTTNQALFLKENSVTSNKSSFVKLDGLDDFMSISQSAQVGSFFAVFNYSSTANFGGYSSLFVSQGTPSKGIIMMGLPGNTNYYPDCFTPSEFEVNGVNTPNMAPLAKLKMVSGITNTATAFSSFFIGKYHFDGSSFWKGNVGDIIVYNTALTTAQKLSVNNYLNDKYAPPINLGPDKTICSLPITIKAKKDYFTAYLWNDNSTNDSLVINAPGIYYLTTTNYFGKTSTDTITINIDTFNYSVNLGSQDTILCSGNYLTLKSGPSHLSYNWSTGVTQNSIQVSAPGKYYVSTTDCNNNPSSDTINVIISPKPIFNLGRDTLICFNANTLTLSSSLTNPNQYTFLWSNGLVTETLSPTTSQKYWLEVKNSDACFFSDTINITIDSSLYSVSLGSDVSLCSGNSIALTSGANQTLAYTWSDNSHNTSLLINNSNQYSVIVTNTNNCTAKDTINVTILGQAPTVSFASGIGCKNNSVSFTNLSSAPSGNSISNTNWDFGDPLSPANTSTLSNPFHTFSDTGIYSVTLQIITNVGCEQSLTKTIHIAPKPIVNFTYGISCQNDSTSFSGSINSGNYPVTSVIWNFGDPNSGIANTSSRISPKHLFTNQASYTIKLVTTNSAGCKDSLSNTIAVKAQVVASFSYSPPCANTATTFQDNSIVPAPSLASIRSWNFGTTTSTGIAVSKTYTTTGVYSVMLTVTGSNGCISKNTKLINVFNSPVASFTIPTFCSKDTISMINLSNPQSGILSSYNWKLNNFTFSSAQSPTLSLASIGTYTVKLNVVNSFSCKDSVTKTITVLPLPNVDFTTLPTTYYYINSLVTFTPTIPNGSLYQWNIDGSTYSIQSPTVNFSEAISYTASLYMQDSQGCGNRKSKTFNVLNRFLDLAVLSVRSSITSGNYFAVEVDLVNLGSIPVTTFDISYKINDAGSIKETANLLINPNGVSTYTFIAKTLSKNNKVNHRTCVAIESTNTISDANSTNNNLCIAEGVNDVVVSDPYPNPTDGDLILPIILNRDQDYTLEIINSLGQKTTEESINKGYEGLNLVSIPTTSYVRGCYLIKIMVNDKMYMKKFIKNKN